MGAKREMIASRTVLDPPKTSRLPSAKAAPSDKVISSVGGASSRSNSACETYTVSPTSRPHLFLCASKICAYILKHRNLDVIDKEIAIAVMYII